MLLISNQQIINDYESYLQDSENAKYKQETINYAKEVIRKFSNYENICMKDMFSYSYKNLIDMFSFYKWTKLGTFNVKKTYITDFIMYCTEQKLCTQQYLMLIKSIKSNVFDNSYIYKTDYYKNFNELNQFIMDGTDDIQMSIDNNIMSIGIIYLIWLGFTMKEIVNIRNSDYDYKNETIHCELTGRTMKVPYPSMNEHFHKIQCTKSYLLMNNRTNKYTEREYENTSMFIKSKQKGFMSEAQARQIVSNLADRMRSYSVNSDLYGKNISSVGIFKNGIFVKMYEAEKKSGVTIVKSKDTDKIIYIDKMLNGLICEGKGVTDNPKITRIRNIVVSYLEWRKVYYGY